MKKIKTLLFMGSKIGGKLSKDNIAAFSAMTAYFTLMSVIPFIMILLLLIRFLPISLDSTVQLLKHFFALSENSLFISIFNQIYLRSNTTLLSVTILTLLWSASKGVMSIITGLNNVFDIKESRNYFIIRFVSIFYTILFMLIIVITIVLLVLGNSIYLLVCTHWPLLEPAASLLIDLKDFFSVFVLTFFFLLVYKFLPNRKANFHSQFIGAVFTSVGWSVFSFGFSIYISHFSNYVSTYGSLGGILLFLLWLYFIMYILFIGAEINHFFANNGLKILLKYLPSLNKWHKLLHFIFPQDKD